MADPYADDTNFRDAHLILLAHGSERAASGAMQARQHAETLRRRGVFGDVTAAFLRDDPHPRDVVANATLRDIYIVPFMASDGYSIETLIPEALGLSGELTELVASGRRQRFHICRPVGTHEALLDWQVGATTIFANRLPEAEKPVSIIVAAHGTDRHAGNYDRARDVVDALKAATIAESVDALFLDQAPSLDLWPSRVSTRTVLVVPFFMSLGRHARHDVPSAFGFSGDDAVRHLSAQAVAGPFPQGEHRIYYGPLLGACPSIPDVTLARAREWEAPWERSGTDD